MASLLRSLLGRGPEALFDAIRDGQLDRVRQLIADGANVNVVDGGRTPVLMAVKHRRKDALAALAAAGADLDAIVHVDGRPTTPLEDACFADDHEVVRELLRLGANPERRSVPEAYPLLCEALHRRQWELAAALVEGGANVNHGSDAGVPPLCYSVSHPAMVLRLATLGARINFATNAGTGALHTALQRNTTPVESVRLLLALGADANQQSHEGVCPLHRAVQFSAEAVRALLEAGASPVARDRSGRSPLDVRGPGRAALVEYWKLRKLP